MLMTLIFVRKFCEQNFSNKDIDIMNVVRRFQNFISGILTWRINITSDYKRFFCKAFLNLNFMATWCLIQKNNW